MLEKQPFNKNSQERKERRTKLFFVFLLFLLILAGVLVAFFRKAEFQVKNFTVEGVQALDPALVQKVAKDYLVGNYLIVIPRTNVLLVSKTGMERYLMAKIPALESVQVNFSGRTNAHIVVVEKKPDYTWCRGDACYFVDRAGVIYEEAPKFSPGIFISFVGGTLPVGTDPLRARFVTPADFATITDILGVVASYPMHILSVEYMTTPSLVPGGQPENTGDITLAVDQIKDIIVSPTTRLLITKDLSTDSMLQSMDLLLADKAFSDTLAVKGPTLDYIDFRFPGKIYYKFASGAAAVSGASADAADTPGVSGAAQAPAVSGAGTTSPASAAAAKTSAKTPAKPKAKAKTTATPAAPSSN